MDCDNQQLAILPDFKKEVNSEFGIDFELFG
jgi:hypothetical protein